MTTKIGPSGLQESYVRATYTRLFGLSFSTGATMRGNQLLLDSSTGKYYRWEGEYINGEHVVSPGTSPLDAGFVYTYSTTDSLTPEDFGAIAGKDATQAINALIQYSVQYGSGVVRLDKVYLVSPSEHPGLPGTFGSNSVCIKAVSGLSLVGTGRLKLRAGTGGVSGAVVGNWDGSPISDCNIFVNIDGNSGESTGQVSGIVLVNATNCHCLGAGVTVKGCSFNGVQFALSSLGCSASSGTIKQIGYIGLQFQKPDGCTANCVKLYDIGDNAIDCESNNGATDQSIISGCTINGCNSGIFLESGGNAIVFGNTIEVFRDAGILCNQINTPSRYNNIYGNTIKRGVGVGVVGIKFVNNCGYSSVHGNMFIDLDYSIWAEVGTHLNIGVNTHHNIQKQLLRITAVSNALTHSVAAQQVLTTPRNVSTGYPFACSPMGNSYNHGDRDYNCTISPLLSMETGQVVSASSDAEYVRGTYSTVSNPGWGGAYAIFVDGHTLVNMPAISSGDYVMINGALFYLYEYIGGAWHIISTSGAEGDYTATVNGLHTATEYFFAWQND